MTRIPPAGRLRAAVLAALAALCLAGAPARGGEIVIGIDPGHGGIDPGASSGGLVEKQVVLDFARRLARHIEAAPGLRPLMLRDDDSFLTFTQRIRRARESGAHVILSLHADTTEAGQAEGAHVYTLAPIGSDAAAEELAERENRAEIIGGVALAGESDDLALLLVDLAQRGSTDEAEKLARATLRALQGTVPLLPNGAHRRANFRILKAPEIPSVLVELGYMSNEADRARLASETWSEQMAAGLVQGIADWAAVASPGFLAPKR